MSSRKTARVENMSAQASARNDDYHGSDALPAMAQELRHPLGAVRAAAEVLRLVCTDAVELHAINIIDRETALLTQRLNDLLGAQKLRRAHLSLREGLVDIGLVANRALDRLRPEMDARQQNLYISLPAQP